MNVVKTALSGFAAGAVAMYFSDPDRGKRRRAIVRGQSVRMWNSFSRLLDKAERDAVNRARGVGYATQAVFRNRRTDDQILVERVRSQLGRLVSHPHAIDVTAKDAKIVLKGDLLQSELRHLVRCVKAVPGVENVEEQLKIHESSEHISSLQGGSRRESRSELRQQNWTPALRMGAGAVGGALISYTSRKKGPLALAGGFAGAALLGRAVCNRELRDLVGIGDGARAVEFDKTMHIQAPVEEVFRYFSDYEKLPCFMTHLKEVRDLGSGKSHWVAEGPGGMSISWDAEVTQSVPNKLLAWRSLPGSRVDTEGVVRFDQNSNGGTRLTVRMWYKPPAGVFGHYVAALFGTDPKSEIDDDLVRLKSLIEVGKTRAHGVRVNRESMQRA
jgi:uncharacterized membrane protein